MPSPPALLTHGASFEQCAPEVWTESARRIDSVSTEWIAPTRDEATLAIGAPFPDHPHMSIVQGIRTQEGDIWHHRITAEGIAGNQDWKELAKDLSQPQQGWDELSLRILTRQPDDNRWDFGQQLRVADASAVVPGYELLWITDRGQSWEEAAGYYELPLTLKGLKGAKPVVRRMSANAVQFQTQFPGSTSVIGDLYTGFPPQDSGFNPTLTGTDINVTYSSPEAVVADTMVTTTKPDPSWLSLFWEPDNAPAISVLTFTGTTAVYNFPWGWVCTSLESEQIPGQNVWLLTLTWTYKRISTYSD